MVEEKLSLTHGNFSLLSNLISENFEVFKRGKEGSFIPWVQAIPDNSEVVMCHPSAVIIHTHELLPLLFVILAL